MNEMKLYRLLQALTGELNSLVVALYNGEIEATEAREQATEQLEAARGLLQKEQENHE